MTSNGVAELHDVIPESVEGREHLFELMGLTKEFKKGAADLGADEARHLVGGYYQMQEHRKSTANQKRATNSGDIETPILDWMLGNIMVVERQIRLLLKHFADGSQFGVWAQSNLGIGPVLTAGLAAHIDITKAPTASALQRFAGLDPSSKWLGRDKAKAVVKEVLGRVSGPVSPEDVAKVALHAGRKAQSFYSFLDSTAWTAEKLASVLSRRPWNADLKTLCVHPDQQVTTRRGYIPIKNVVVGDMVLTHRGRFRRVTDVFKRDFTGTLYRPKLHGFGNSGPQLTGEHPVYATIRPISRYEHGGRKRWRRGSTKREANYRRAERVRELVGAGATQRAAAADVGVSESAASLYVRGRLSEPPTSMEWRPISSIESGIELYSPIIPDESTPVVMETSRDGMVDVGGVLLAEGRWEGVPHPMAKPVPAEVGLTPNLAYVIGLYLSEGHTSHHTTGWSFHENEVGLIQAVQEEMENVLGSTSIVSHNEPNHCKQVIVSSKAIAATFGRLFGKGARSKGLPTDWLTRLHPELLGRILDGVFDGDGYLDEGARMLTTVSKTLAWQVREMLLRLGRPASISEYEQNGSFVYKVREQKCPERYYRDDVGFWHPTVSILTREYSGTVYNLEVEEDHSYVVEGVAVHNCWKVGQSFIKVSGNSGATYGRLYVERKVLEEERNGQGLYADQAAEKLATHSIGKDTVAYSHYIEGRLPPSHIVQRASRWATKIFLADVFAVMYYIQYAKSPPVPYIIAHSSEHTQLRDPPNMQLVPGMREAWKATRARTMQ